MSRDTRLADIVVNAQADALAKLADGGFLDIYDGERPEGPHVPVKGQKLGVTLKLAAKAFLPAADGVLKANALTGARAVAKINASWARVFSADHKTALIDISVGKEGLKERFNLELPNTEIVEGVMVTTSSFTHSVPKVNRGS